MKLVSFLVVLFFVFGCGQSGYKAPQSELEAPESVDPVDTLERESFLDILLVVDDSGSMLSDNQKLATYLGDLADDLNLDEINWQMCITTTDVDYYEGRVLLWRNNDGLSIVNPESDYKTVFTETIDWIGHGWSDDEQGIKAMNLALKEPANSGCFRDGAALAVILISDEDERSVGGDADLDSDQYKELGELNSAYVFMDSVFEEFGTAKRVIVHSIIVTSNECKAEQDADGSLSFIGTKYKELSDLTNGEVISICGEDYLLELDFFGDQVSDPINL